MNLIYSQDFKTFLVRLVVKLTTNVIFLLTYNEMCQLWGALYYSSIFQMVNMGSYKNHSWVEDPKCKTYQGNSNRTRVHR